MTLNGELISAIYKEIAETHFPQNAFLVKFTDDPPYTVQIEHEYAQALSIQIFSKIYPWIYAEEQKRSSQSSGG